MGNTKSWLGSVILALVLVGCGQQMQLNVASITASRLPASEIIELKVGIECQVVGDANEASKIEEVCVEAKWAEELVADGGTPVGAPASYTRTPGSRPLPTGPTLHTAKACTQDKWKDGEVKVLVLESAEAIPKKPLVISTLVSGKAPKSSLFLSLDNFSANQISSP